MLDKIRLFIEKNGLLERGDGIVIGVSGGADSICLFHLLLRLREEWDLSLHVVHVHHGIRGSEADLDEAFVRETLRGRADTYRCIKEDVKAMAKKNKLSVEEAGRTVRYRAFHQTLKEVGGKKIATGHNQNDQAETVLFQLCRGSGLRGLVGMAPKRGNLIRPLLCVNRNEIEGFLKREGVPYREDSTNQEYDYVRNRIRHKAIPLLEEEVNAGTVRHIANTANLLLEYQKYMEKKVQERFLRIVTEKDGLYSYQVEPFLLEDDMMQKELLRHILVTFDEGLRDVEAVHIEMLRDLAGKTVGKRVELPGGIVGVKGYDKIQIGRGGQVQTGEDVNKNVVYRKIDPPCVVKIDKEYEFSFEIMELLDKNQKFPKNVCTKWFDYDRIKGTVFIRNTGSGDYLVYDSEGHKKKLNRFFIDNKIPRMERERYLVLAEGNHVIWLVNGKCDEIGTRISEAYKVNENTKRVLKVKCVCPAKTIDKGKEEV